MRDRITLTHREVIELLRGVPIIVSTDEQRVEVEIEVEWRDRQKLRNLLEEKTT